MRLRDVENMRERRQILTVILISTIFSVSNLYYASGNDYVYVGAYYYVWYEKDNWHDCPDIPVRGYYGSENHTIIKEHLRLCERIGIDFLIISYNPWTQSHISYVNAKEVFKVAREIDSRVQLCFIVESNPVNESRNNYNFTKIHNLIYEEYASQTHYFNWQGKPLLLYYNAKTMTKDGEVPRDERFAHKIVGHEGYVDWAYVMHYEGNLLGKFDERNPSDRHICVSPAYSDVHFRTPGWSCDVDYSKGYYQKEWEYAIDHARKGNVDIITISSFNEFAERTAFEPHIRKDCNFSSHYACHLTEEYIDKLRASETLPPSPWYLDSTTFAIAILIIVIAVFVVRKLWERDI